MSYLDKLQCTNDSMMSNFGALDCWNPNFEHFVEHQKKILRPLMANQNRLTETTGWWMNYSNIISTCYVIYVKFIKIREFQLDSAAIFISYIIKLIILPDFWFEDNNKGFSQLVSKNWFFNKWPMTTQDLLEQKIPLRHCLEFRFWVAFGKVDLAENWIPRNNGSLNCDHKFV